MKILSAGGGSGGHVTPVLAVINELKQLDPDLEAHFVCDSAFESQARGLMSHALVPVSVHVIVAGKFRRYHGVSLLKQLLDLPTVLRNIRDLFYITAGFIQSLWLLSRLRPDVVFAKGGYVCLPLGIAARLWGVPLVIHDSDTRPGLTNKLLARCASRIATGSPLSNYNYPSGKSTYTGVPIDSAFHPFTESEQQQAKQTIGIVDTNKPLIVVTGGGLGAQSINEGVVATADKLLNDGFALYHVTGKKHFNSVKDRAEEHPDYHIVEFVYKDMATVLGAADIVVSRASATFLQELAALKKPTVIVPAAHLGDQVKNAEVYRSAKAALVVNDAVVRDGVALYEALTSCHANRDETLAMMERFYAFARPEAAQVVAGLIYGAPAESRH